MTERYWSFDDLARFLRFEDPEVRYWAADRLAHHFPEQATDLLAPFLFDDHDLTPELVAVHLGAHGQAGHGTLLARGVRTHRGLAAARALEAMVRLKAPDAVELVRKALDRRDFDEECWSWVVTALAERGDGGARAVLQDFLKKRADWFGSPPILRSALMIAGPGEHRPLLHAWIRSIQWGGVGGGDAGEAFRVLMDHLEIDDCGWCFRTSLSGRIDFHKTLKAIESNYDCDLDEALPAEDRQRIAAALQAGEYETIARVLGDWIRARGRSLTRPAGDALLDRILEVTAFWSDPEVARAVEGLGPHLQEWVIGFLLAAVFKMARYRNFELEIRRSADDLQALLGLLEVETSAMLETLPEALRRAVEAAGGQGTPERSAARRAVEERCLAILSCRGPFFPQVMALETFGALRSAGAINEIIDFLAEDNSYLYEAAEHALSHMDEAIVEPARARLESGNLDEEVAHSLLVLLCEQGTKEAFKVVFDHLDTFMEAAGPGDAARWASLFGARELIEPLRRQLPQDMALVGQSALLLAAIHNTRVPEEAAIRRAIDEFWKKSPEGDGGGGESGSGDGSDKYLM